MGEHRQIRMMTEEEIVAFRRQKRASDPRGARRVRPERDVLLTVRQYAIEGHSVADAVRLSGVHAQTETARKWLISEFGPAWRTFGSVDEDLERK